MTLILSAIGLLLISGLGALFINRFAKTANFVGSTGAVIASLLGLGPVVYHLLGAAPESCCLRWAVPYGSFSLAIDPLSAFFLFPVFILSAVAALYGRVYLKHFIGKKSLGGAWFFYNLLISSMVMVVIARNAILFLLAWEVMAVSSFFLVMFEGEKAQTGKAGLIYLIAAHIGTAFLLVMFILLGRGSGSLDFGQFSIAGGILPSLIFLLAVVGFGVKAGIIPLHIWLPEAHPAAPSYVSAVMSGVMIKTGIYGLVRVLTFLGTPPVWWGGVLIVIGITSGIFGVLFALAQHDLKRLLAYHSIENIGIIVMGLGLGVLGLSLGNPVIAVLGFAGGLLHVVNHAFFKGLLFLVSGAVLQATGTRDIEALGGLLKKMPVSGFCFLIGAAAISGLPPLNGFISEFLIYLASLKSIFGSSWTVLASLSIITALAVIGGLAVACFTKAFGIVFLGEPRSAHCETAQEPPAAMQSAMIILAAGCIAIGLAAPAIIVLFPSILVEITGFSSLSIQENIAAAITPLEYIISISLCLLMVLLVFVILRRELLSKRKVEKGLTWDCGYAQPAARMQYSASSFAQPLTDFFGAVLKTRKHSPQLKEYFPTRAFFATETPDIFQRTIYRWLSEWTSRMARRCRWFQHGHLQFYILYILISLLAMLIWKLW